MNMVCWICPECGRENDATLQDCPGCAPVAVTEPATAAESAPKPQAEKPAPVVEIAPIAEEPAPVAEPAPPRFAPKVPIPLSAGHDCGSAPAACATPECLGGIAVLECAPETLPAPETGLALARRVHDPAPRPPFVSIGASPAMPEPWQRVALNVLALPLPPLDPDHAAALGFQHDLSRLLDALRQSPGLPLLGAGGVEPKALARPQDLEYFREPKSLAARVRWQATVSPANAQPDIPRQNGRRQAWPERAGALPELSTEAPVAVFAPPCDERQPWNPEVPPRTAAIQPVECPAHTRLSDGGVILPFFLRRFQENSILVSPRVITQRSATPGWVVTVLTAIILIVTAATFLPKSTFAQHGASAADAPASEAALGAFPSFSRYVEVTGIRAATDTGNAEIRYVVVNHSPTDLPAFSINVSVVPARGGAPLFSFSASVQSMAPNESRELRAAIPQTLQASEMPDWQDLRSDVRVTARE